MVRVPIRTLSVVDGIFYHKKFSDTRYSMGAYISLETLSKRIWWCMLQTKIILYPSTCKTIGHYGKGVCEYHTIWDNVFLFLITFIHEWVSFLGSSYVSCEECNQNVICFIFRIFQYIYIVIHTTVVLDFLTNVSLMSRLYA